MKKHYKYNQNRIKLLLAKLLMIIIQSVIVLTKVIDALLMMWHIFLINIYYRLSDFRKNIYFEEISNDIPIGMTIEEKNYHNKKQYEEKKSMLNQLDETNAPDLLEGKNFFKKKIKYFPKIFKHLK